MQTRAQTYSIFGNEISTTSPGSGANYSFQNIPYANLANDFLAPSDFLSTTLTSATFASSNLTDATFTAARLTAANLTSANARYTNFSSSILTSANLISTNFTSTTFSSATLTNATINYANFSFSTLSSSQLYSTSSYVAHDLTGVSFAGLNLNNYNLTSENLTSASFNSGSLTGAVLTGATVASADFTSSKLTTTQLYSTASYVDRDLSGVNFTGSSLVAANLSSQALIGSNFSTANLASANLTSANLSGATLVHAMLSSADFNGANFSSADLMSSSFANVDFTSADFALADFRSASSLNQQFPATTDVRGAIGIGGLNGIKAFTFNPGETLHVRGSSENAVTYGTISGPSSGTAFVSLEPDNVNTFDQSSVLQMTPTASTTSYVRALDNVGLVLQGSLSLQLTPDAWEATLTATPAGRTLLPIVSVLSSLTFANDGKPLGSRTYVGVFDLGTNDAVIRNGSLPDVSDMARDYLATNGEYGLGASGPTLWLGASATIAYSGVAVIQNISGISGVPLFSNFDGVSVGTTDLLIKFTYIGDTDLNGVVDGNDLTNLLAGMNGGLTGWQNGDLNYDGHVNGTDLNLLLTSLRGQGGSLGDSTSPSGGTGGAIPEPTALAVLLGLTPSLSRRPRRQRGSILASGRCPAHT